MSRELKGINGTGIAAVAGGLVFVTMALKGSSVTDTVRAFLAGKTPTGTPLDTGTVDPTGAAIPPGTNVGGTAEQNKAIGRILAAPYGWSNGANWDALVKLWTRESNWNNKAKNVSSGAYGIPQALPESKLPKAGQESGGSSATAQISWGLAYIRERYGSPVAAWAHETSAGWY
jgi:hypothetical protein